MIDLKNEILINIYLYHFYVEKNQFMKFSLHFVSIAYYKSLK